VTRKVVVAICVCVAATACGGRRAPHLADGSWYGNAVTVDVGRRTLAFAPTCRLGRSRWVAIRRPTRSTVPIARRADLEIYFRPNGSVARGHGQPAGLRELARAAADAPSPASPAGWFVTVRHGVAVSVEESSGIRSADPAVACVTRG
jgi:hypothetical protein